MTFLRLSSAAIHQVNRLMALERQKSPILKRFEHAYQNGLITLDEFEYVLQMPCPDAFPRIYVQGQEHKDPKLTQIAKKARLSVEIIFIS